MNAHEIKAKLFTHPTRFDEALIGDDGITPAWLILDRAADRGKEKQKKREAWNNSSASAGTSVK